MLATNGAGAAAATLALLLLLTRGLAQDAATLPPRAPASVPATQPVPAPTSAPTAPAALDAASARLLSGLIGSKHDFTKPGQGHGELCLPCHAPHLTAVRTPLYDQRPATTQPLRAYQSLETSLSHASLLCLSCHDGVFAPDVYTSSHATTVASQLGGVFGRRSLTGHPIGIRYPVGEPGYNSLGGSAEEPVKLVDGRIQCTTCHNPHNTQRHAGMLVFSNERSRLCLTCHRL